MKKNSVVITALAWSVFAAGVVAGQAPRFEVTARAGMLFPLNELGAVAPSGDAWHLRLARADATPTFEVAARAAWPGSFIGTRIVGSWAVPTDASGFFNCNPGFACPAVLLPRDAEVGMQSLVGDLIISPLERNDRIRPWAALGAGIRRYDYSWNDGNLINAGSHSETSLALHAGLGMSLDLPFGALQLEVADYWTPESGAVVPIAVPASGGSTGSVPRRDAQHDIVLNLGWRLIRF